jgi:hypothetical protein
MRQLIRGATTRSIERAHCCAGAGPRMDGAAASLAQTLSTNALDLQHIADRLEGEVSVPLPRSVSLSLSACALRGT